MKSLKKNVLILFSLGFFLGPIGDFCHVVAKTTGYPQGIFGIYFFRIPFWVPFLFGLATLAIGLSHPRLDRLLGKPPVRPGMKNWTKVGTGILLFLSLYGISGFMPWKTGGINDLVLAGLGLFLWWEYDRSWQGIVLGILTAIAGTCVEIALVHLGAFFYLPPKNNLFGVASWLPWLYFAASVTVGNLGRRLDFYTGKLH